MVSELCGEITAWGLKSENAKNPKSLELKEKAAALSARLINGDFDNGDKYYKLYEEYGKIKFEYEEIKSGGRYVYTDIKGSSEKLFKNIKDTVAPGRGVVLNKSFMVNKGRYGDFVNVVVEGGEEGVELIIIEMHDTVVYENSLINKIKQVFENLDINYEHKEHTHESKTVEHQIKCSAEKLEELEKLLSSIFEVIEKTKRIPKKD